MQIDYAYTAIEAESRDPKTVYERIMSYIENLRKEEKT